MPRNTLSRRSMLQMTTGAAIAAPAALAGGTHAAKSENPTNGPTFGPPRHLTGTILFNDESADPSPFRGITVAEITIDIVPDGRGVLTLRHAGQESERSVLVPADVAREIDRILFFTETERERLRREKRAAGYIDCLLCSERYPCAVCDCDRLIHPSTITRHLGPWFTGEDVRPELHRIPVAWGAEVTVSHYWHGESAKQMAGTSEEGRIDGCDIRLHGLGWGGETPPDGDLPDGPSIFLEPSRGTHHYPVDPYQPFNWCACLPGEPVHGGAGTISEALGLAVASIERRLGGMAVMA